jgi:hypothetical protein
MPWRSTESTVWYPNCGLCLQNWTYLWPWTATSAFPIRGPQAHNASDRRLMIGSRR